MNWKIQMTIAIITIIIAIIIVIIAISKQEHFGNCGQLEVHEIKSKNVGPCIGIIGGVHGNEPAGSVTLNNLIQGKWHLPLKRGKLIVIPSANQCGLAKNSRWQPNVLHPDLNRNFTENGGIEYKSKQIADAFKDCDLVIDIHEGWGFHKIQPSSLGSTLSPTETPKAQMIASKMLHAINQTIPNPAKHFTQINDISCEIPTTLSCYMNHHNRDYILIEITGQNDIQPIELRERQSQTLLTAALAHLNMI